MDLIEAGRLLRDKGLPVKILIVGDGSERSAIEQHIRNRQMQDCVVITGFQQDVRPYVALSDIFALCSATETFSISILEAMAMGKAIVAPAIGGVPEQVVHGKNGLLFPPGDVTALADCLATIITKGTSEAMGLESRALVRDRFSVEQMVTSYENLLEKK
jgi:glycosyltransferase involved in cell wall biosynthesis